MELLLNMSRVIGIYAPQKYGKTELTKYLIKQYTANGVKVFIYDTDMEKYSSYKGLKDVAFVMSKDITDLENQEFFNKAIVELRAKFTNFLLVVEDIDKVIQSKIKSKDTLEIYKLASDSRHQRIAVIYTTKTPRYIPTTLRLNTNLFFFGKFVEPDFIKYITQIVPKELYDTIRKPSFVVSDVWSGEVNVVKLDLEKGKLVKL